jgi:hypothetical protein
MGESRDVFYKQRDKKCSCLRNRESRGCRDHMLRGKKVKRMSGKRILRQRKQREEKRLCYLSILMATKFKMLAVLSVTSNAIQKSQIVSLNSQSTLTFHFPVHFV